MVTKRTVFADDFSGNVNIPWGQAHISELMAVNDAEKLRPFLIPILQYIIQLFCAGVIVCRIPLSV